MQNILNSPDPPSSQSATPRPRRHPQHIVQRGHNRQPCFFAEDDYGAYLAWLAEAAEREGCAIHAYVLMTNHVHLLVTPQSADSVARLTVSLGRRYVQYINKTYQRSGTLWEGRYKASLVQSEAYLLACMRYIELNPVRAGMCTDPAHYRWSSYRANGLGETTPWLSPHALYTSLAAGKEQRCADYRALCSQVLDTAALADIRAALNQTQPLGNARFLDAIEAATGQRREVRPRGRPRVKSENN